MNRRLAITSLVVGLAFPFCNANVQGQTALPNLGFIGTDAQSSSRLLNSSNAAVYPKQVSVDFSKKGTVSGLACEYEGTKDQFDKLKKQIQDIAGVAPRMSSTNIVVWRLEDRKLAIQLNFMSIPPLDSEDEKKVRVIVTSFDKSIRGF